MVFDTGRKKGRERQLIIKAQRVYCISVIKADLVTVDSDKVLQVLKQFEDIIAYILRHYYHSILKLYRFQELFNINVPTK